MKKSFIVLLLIISIHSYAQEKIGFCNIEIGMNKYQIEQILNNNNINYIINTNKKGERFYRISSAKHRGYEFDGLNIYIESDNVVKAVFFASDGGTGDIHSWGVQETIKKIHRCLENLFTPISENFIKFHGEPVVIKDNNINDHFEIELAWFFPKTEVHLRGEYITNIDGGNFINVSGGCWIEYKMKK